MENTLSYPEYVERIKRMKASGEEVDNNKLRYFKGKCVSVFSKSTPAFYSSKEFANTYVGRVVDMDDQGLWLQDMGTETYKMFFWDDISGIAECQVTTLTDEELEKVKQAKQGGQNQNVHVPVDSLVRSAAQLKARHGELDPNKPGNDH